MNKKSNQEMGNRKKVCLSYLKKKLKLLVSKNLSYWAE